MAELMAEQGGSAGAEAAEAATAAHDHQFGITQRCFSEEASDVVVHFQIVSLEQQVSTACGTKW